MRKYTKIFVAVLLTVFLFSNLTCAVNLADVPQNHWAYDSVKKLVEEGYLTLYNDNTFNGDKPVSRYELAVLVARMLDNMSTSTTPPGEEDVDTIRKLSLEFRDELVEIAQNQDVFSESLTEIEKKINIMENEDIPKLYSHTNNMEQKINDNKNEIEKIIDTIVRIKTLEEQVTELQSQVSSLEKDVADTGLKIDEKEQLINDIQGDIDQNLQQKINEQHTNTMSKIQSLENRINELENQLAVYQTSESEEEAKKKDENTALYLGAAAVIILLASMN